MYVNNLNNVNMCMIIYHDENLHYEMMLFTSFVLIHDAQDVDGHVTLASVERTGIDDSEGDIGDVHTAGGTYYSQAISYGSGKPCVIVLSYTNCISYRTLCKSVCKNDST